MKRFIIIILSVLVILFAVFALCYFNSAYIVSRIVSSKLGTKVKIEKILFNPPEIFFKGIKIKNPMKGASKYALEVGSTDIIAPYKNYFHDVIKIDNLELTDVEISVETTSSGTNWSEILKNASDPSKPNDQSTKKEERYAVIKELQILNMSVHIYALGSKTPTVHKIPNLKMKNVKTKEGDITRRISQLVLFHMIKNIPQNLIDIPIQAGKETFNSFLKPFEKIFTPSEEKSETSTTPVPNSNEIE